MTGTGKKPLSLSDRNFYFGTGPTIQYVLDPDTGARRDSSMADIEKAAKLVDCLPNLDFCMTMGMTGGVTPQTLGLNSLVTDRFDFAAMVRNTTKPLMFSIWSLAGLKDCYEMAKAVRGGDEESLREKPFFLVYCEPTTPLIHDQDPMDIALFCAEKSIPLLNIPAPVAGGSGPVTLAGCLVLSNAEVLSGLAIAQLKNKGRARGVRRAHRSLGHENRCQHLFRPGMLAQQHGGKRHGGVLPPARL